MGEVLCFTAIVLVYSSGLPALFLVGFINFSITYFVDRLTVLRFYSSPPMYDEALVKTSARMIPTFVGLHLLFGFGFWGRMQGYALSDGHADQLSSVNQESPFDMSARLSNIVSLFKFFMLVLFTVYYVLKYFPVFLPIWRFFGKLQKMLCTKKARVAPETDDDTVIRGLKEDNPTFPEALKGCEHNSVRALPGSNNVVRKSAINAKPPMCAGCNPVDLLFGCW